MPTIKCFEDASAKKGATKAGPEKGAACVLAHTPSLTDEEASGGKGAGGQVNTSTKRTNFEARRG